MVLKSIVATAMYKYPPGAFSFAPFVETFMGLDSTVDRRSFSTDRESTMP
jgi:hypothetical protein